MSEPVTKAILWAGIAAEQLGAGLAGIPHVALQQVQGLDGFLQALPGAEIVALPSYHYTAETARALRERGGTVRFLQLLTAGYEQLEPQGVPAHITVANASPAMAPAVAEHAVALLLALARNLPEFVRNQQSGTWDRKDFKGLRSIAGARIAIVGFGHIGQGIAQRLRPFGAQIIAVSRARHEHPLADEVTLLEDLDHTVATIDAIMTALPHSPATHHLIGAGLLAAVKPGAVLVNIARGGLVDTAAVIAALGSGRLSGFATDVTEAEPLPAGSPLWSAPNVLITPHVAAADGDAAGRRLASFAAGNIARYLAGETPDSRITVRSPESVS